MTVYKENDAVRSNPKFNQVVELMKGESVTTIENILLDVISYCRASSKCL